MTIEPKELLQSALDKLWRPVTAIVILALFLFWVVAEATRSDLFDQFVHISGVALVVMGPILILIGACYWVFDFAFSFREFAQSIGKWSKNPKSIDSKDATIILAMAIRSGLVFLAVSILFVGGMIYIDH